MVAEARGLHTWTNSAATSSGVANGFSSERGLRAEELLLDAGLVGALRLGQVLHETLDTLGAGRPRQHLPTVMLRLRRPLS